MKFTDFLKSTNYSSEINEEFRTDEEGIKQLQAKEAELYKKIRPLSEKGRELDKKMNSLIFQIGGIGSQLVDLAAQGEKRPEAEKELKKLNKEYKALEAEAEKVFPKIYEIEDEIKKIHKVVNKMIQRNAKKLGLTPFGYVMDYNLYSRA